MDYKEAIEWFTGKRSMTNIIPSEPFQTWNVRIAEADAAMMQQAYWYLKAHKEKLLQAYQQPVEVDAKKCTCKHNGRGWNSFRL